MTPEFEQYRIDQAEAWLSKVRKVVAYAARLEESAAAHYALADGLRGIDYSRDQVSTSPNADAIPNAVAAHVDMGDSFTAIAEDARRRVAEAERAIDALPDRGESTCLRLYYVDALPRWTAVADRMDGTYDMVMRLRRRALLHVYDLMPYAEREPVQPAI